MTDRLLQDSIKRIARVVALTVERGADNLIKRCMGGVGCMFVGDR